MPIDSSRERRREHRVSVSATAVVFLEGVELGEFAVDNLSLTGALLTGDVGATVGDQVTVLLFMGAREAIDLDAHVVRIARSHACTKMAVELEHTSSFTEDALREALLGARSRSELPPPPPDLQMPTPWDLDDPDLVDIFPAPR